MYLRFILLVWLISGSVFAAPNVVVSIKPIHSIVSSITQDITEPKLLLKTQESAHHFHLKPSQLSSIENADLVVAIHPNMEIGLNKALSSIPQHKKIYIVRYDEHSKHLNSSQNYHIWLDINNMQEFAKKLTDKLITIDSENKSRYLSNLNKLNKKLDTLQKNIQQKLSAYAGKPVASFSNAFEYFINSNKLKLSTTVTKFHEERLSIYKVLNAKNTIKNSKTKCLIATKEVSDKQINILSEGLNINTARIDIIGFGIKQNVDHYFELMNNIGSKVEKCLQ